MYIQKQSTWAVYSNRDIMIFVTVGTHEQPFNRLVKAVDDLKASDILSEPVIIQTGYSDYEPRYCEFSKFYPYQQMVKFVNEARIVITHGGPSSFIMPLQIGKIPIVVPRKKEFNEHVNNHQVNFCKAVAQRQGNIIVVEEIEKLGETITNYDTLIDELPAEMKSNNAQFCAGLEKVMQDILKHQG